MGPEGENPNPNPNTNHQAKAPPGDDLQQDRKKGQHQVLPSLAEWIDCEVKFEETEKLHNYPIDVEVEDLKDIAIQTLRNIQNSKSLPESQHLENIQKIKIIEQVNAHMGRAFLVEAQFQGGEKFKFIVKASVDGLRGKGGDLYSQCQAQELCRENGIRVPEVYVRPTIGENSARVFFMAEEFIEGRSPNELSSEELQRLGFYRKFGEYLGRVHLIKDPSTSNVTAESLGRSSIHSILGDDETNVIPAIYTQQTATNERRLVHCDCHLGNVLITKEGEVVVIDWGAAKFDSPYAELQYLLIGSTEEKDKTHDLLHFPPEVAMLLSIPFGGAWEVVPREHIESFLAGYISVNTENIERVKDIDNPVLHMKLLFHKCLELIRHAYWMDSFKPPESEEKKSEQEHFKEMCLNTIKQALKRIQEETSGVSDEYELAEDVGNSALALDERIPHNATLDHMLECERNQDVINVSDILVRSHVYDDEIMEKIIEGLREIEGRLSTFLTSYDNEKSESKKAGK